MRKPKFILWLAVLALFALPLSAQNSTAVNQVGEYWEARHSFAATGWSAPIPVEGRGITNHRVNWVGIGTVTTCVGTLETSPNGFTWTTLITVADCSSNGVSAVTEASTEYIRMRLTTLTGGGTLRVYYLGMPLTGSTVTLAAETTKVIGTVNQGTSPWVVGDGAGALNTIVDSGTITANAGTGTFTVDSELPAAAALTDNMANPTPPAVGAFAMIWDGATWDRWTGNVTSTTLATESTVAAINTKIPTSPATDRTTAAAPFSIRLSTGSAFYNGLTDTELRASAVSVSLPASQTGIDCTSSVVYDASTNGNTELVSLTASQVIYVCGFYITTAATSAVGVRLVYGTGTACATGETSMTPVTTFQNSAGITPTGLVVPVSGHTGLKTAASNALCIETNAAQAVQALVWYLKQ